MLKRAALPLGLRSIIDRVGVAPPAQSGRGGCGQPPTTEMRARGWYRRPAPKADSRLLAVERLPVGADAGIADEPFFGMSFGHILCKL